MAHRVCPWWVGYVLLFPLRRLRQNPRTWLGPLVNEGMVVLEPGPAMGFFTLDLARMVGASGRVVAVEVDGPKSVVGRTPTGATAIKRRQLRAAGWKVLPVPYWEWDTLRSMAAKRQYLQRALEGFGVLSSLS